MKLKNILVTGSGSGIGKGIAREFRFRGWNTSSIEIDEGVQNVSSWISRITEELYLDAMVLNAGVQFFSLEGEFQQSLNLVNSNILGTYYGLYYARNLLKKGSVICVISSNAAYTADTSSPLYHASKSAVSSLVHSFSLIYSGLYRVFGVCPGLVPTNIGGTEGKVPQELVSRVPVRRSMTTKELGRYVYKLMTEFDYLVGEDVVIDGGLRWVRF